MTEQFVIGLCGVSAIFLSQDRSDAPPECGLFCEMAEQEYTA